MSALLPRSEDHGAVGEKIIYINNKLKALCKDRRVIFKPFHKGLIPLRELYAVNDRGLHLNTEGTGRLGQFYINSVAHLFHKIK